MSLVYIGIGSNVDREENIRSCIKCLHQKYSVVSLSPLYETSSMGFDGPNFYNLVCCFETSQDVVVLKTELSVIEKIHGRSMNESKFSSRTLDIDILYYDDLVVRLDPDAEVEAAVHRQSQDEALEWSTNVAFT